MDGPRPAGVIAVILKGYPRLSETFIAQELHALEKHGLGLSLFSLRLPTDPETHPIHAEIRAPVAYLPEYLHHEPFRVWRRWRESRLLPGYRAAVATWWRDFRRDPTRSRIRRLGQAFVLAVEMPRDVVQLHAHFLHTPASVTRYAAILRGLPWSCSAHAKDIWTTPEWEKREKLASCVWLTTCTDANARHLRDLAHPGRPVDLIYHGIDTRRFPPPPAADRAADGTDASRPVRILAVGRAVDKKGFDDLLAALARIPPDRHWRLIHIGGGPMLRQLKAAAQRLGIAASIDVAGSPGAGRGARRVSRRRHFRAALPGQRRWRSRRPAQRLARSPEPETRVRVDANLGYSRTDRGPTHRTSGRAPGRRVAGRCAYPADREPGTPAASGRRRVRARNKRIFAGCGRRASRGPVCLVACCGAMRIAASTP